MQCVFVYSYWEAPPDLRGDFVRFSIKMGDLAIRGDSVKTGNAMSDFFNVLSTKLI